MTQKNFLFNRVLILISFVCGAMISAYVGVGVHNRACPNLNKRAMLQSVLGEIGSVGNSVSGSKLQAIGQQLSPYNKKIANARLLGTIKAAEMKKLTDSYLIVIRDKADELAGKSFAVEEYGRFVTIGIGVCSMMLTTAACWLAICGLVYVSQLICRKV